jgi:primase-polymerase (primpol)-like protein
MWINIPQEMREYKQWICWGAGKVPLRAIDGRNASVTDPRDWTDFDAACRAGVGNNVGIGFVFTAADPFVGIDCDDMDTARQACDYFKSYAELSPSGRGVHIIVRGSVPGGRRRGKIEVYGTGRYFTVTGNGGGIIRDCQPELDVLIESMGGAPRSELLANRRSINPDDGDLLEQAGAKSEKFRELWCGYWRNFAYPSQSEADMELAKMLAYWSRNFEQTLRLFMRSGLYRAPPVKAATYPVRTITAALQHIYAKHPELPKLDW